MDDIRDYYRSMLAEVKGKAAQLAGEGAVRKVLSEWLLDKVRQHAGNRIMFTRVFRMFDARVAPGSMSPGIPPPSSGRLWHGVSLRQDIGGRLGSKPSDGQAIASPSRRRKD